MRRVRCLSMERLSHDMDSMSVRTSLLKKAKQNPEFRKRVIRKLASAIQTDLLDNLVSYSVNNGAFYRRRDAKGAVREAMRRLGVQVPRSIIDKAVREVQETWASEDKTHHEDLYRYRR